MEESNINLQNIQEEIKAIRAKLETKGHEIDILQNEAFKSKKWWKSPSNLVSILALSISVFATAYSIHQENEKEFAEKKLRVKEIMHRLSEIQIQMASAGPHFNTVQQIVYPEVSTLVDEAIEISNDGNNLLNDAEYNIIISMAFQTNKNRKLLELINKALRIVDDESIGFSIRNYQAQYYFMIDINPDKGREIERQQLTSIDDQLLNSTMKTITKAQVYSNWCSNEFSIGELSKSDSLLIIAEKMIGGADSLKFMGYPIVEQIKNQRKFLNNRLN